VEAFLYAGKSMTKLYLQLNKI